MSTTLILGASSDIGIAIARKFAQSGENIQLTARNRDFLESLKSDLEIRYQIQCSTHEFAAEIPLGHESFFESLSPKPDIVIYVIGFMGSDQVLKPWKECKAIIDSNYLGAVSILNLFAGHFASQKKGTIIGISSVAGERGRQSNMVYGSAKAGFSAYLSGLRNYLSPFGVQVITVKPGFVFTKMTSHLTLPPLLTAKPTQVADRIFSAYRKKKNVIFVKGIWRWIMFIIRSIPEPIFKKLKL